MMKKVLCWTLSMLMLACVLTQGLPSAFAVDDGPLGPLEEGALDESLFDGVQESSLFDGVPAYEPDEDVSIELDSPTLDGASPFSEAAYYDSFCVQAGPLFQMTQLDSSFDGSSDNAVSASADDPNASQNNEGPEARLYNGDEEVSPLESFDGDGLLDGEQSDLDGVGGAISWRLWVSSGKCAVGDMLHLETTFTNVNRAELVRYNCDTRQLDRYSPASGVRYRLQFERSGKYYMFMRFWNDSGYYDSYSDGKYVVINVGEPPTGYSMSLSSVNVIPYEKISMQINRRNAKWVRLVIKNTANNAILNNSYVSDNLSFQFTAAGRYAVYLITENDYGTFDGSQHQNGTLYITVRNPAPTAYSFSLTGASVIQPNEKTTIRVSNLGGATCGTIYALRGGSEISHVSFQTSSSFSFSFYDNTPGEYTIYMITSNSYGTYNGKANGNTLRVTVKGAPSDYWMSLSPVAIQLGKRFNYKVDLKSATSYDFVVEKDGASYRRWNNMTWTAFYWQPWETGTYRFYLIAHSDSGDFNGGAEQGYSLTGSVLNWSEAWGYNFVNTVTHVGYLTFENAQGYYDTNEKIHLESYKAVFGESDGQQRFNNAGPWGGSCFGFASSSALTQKYPGLRFAQHYGASDHSAHGIPKPGMNNHNSPVTLMLERFQISQHTTLVSNETSANKNKVTKLVNAVEAYENGGVPVIIGVHGGGSGHALVPVAHHEISGQHVFSVYDCNHPNEMRSLTMSANYFGNLSRLNYTADGHTYSESFDFVSVDTVYNALNQRGAVLMEDGEAPECLTLTVPDGVTLSAKNGSGQEVDLEQYYVSLCDSDQRGRIYIVPTDTYTLTCAAFASQTMDCSVSDGQTSASAQAKGRSVTFYIGKQDGNVRCAARSDEKGFMDIRLINSLGQVSFLNADAGYLGATMDGDSMNVNSDADKISRNGEDVSLDWDIHSDMELDGGSQDQLGTISFDAFDGSSASDLEVIAADSHLAFGDEGVIGTLVLKTENPQDSKAFDVYVALYDSEGKMLGIEKNTAVVGTGQGAAVVELKGSIALTSISFGNLSVRVFLPNADFAPLCKSAQYDSVAIK